MNAIISADIYKAAADSDDGRIWVWAPTARAMYLEINNQEQIFSVILYIKGSKGNKYQIVAIRASN